MLVFIMWKLEWLKILFKLIFKGQVVTALLEYNCFDYYYLWMLLWIFLWILPTLNYYDSQGLNAILELIGEAMKYFLKTLLGHEVSSSMVTWVFFEKFVKTFHPLSTYLMYTPIFRNLLTVLRFLVPSLDSYI